MKLGGTANYVVEATTPDELRQAYLNAKKLKQPVYIIGGGSNLIAHDDGFAGVIVHNMIGGIEVVADDDVSTTVKVGGGAKWDDLAKLTVEHDLAGIAAMSGIPGTVGAAPVQNIGAYGQELSDTFVSLEAYDIHDDKFVQLSSEACEFSYRTSIFRTSAAGRYAITSVTLQLPKGPPQPPFYESLQKRLDEQGITQYTAQIIRDSVLAIRASKLPDPAQIPNSGSFFKNAIVESWKVEELKAAHPDIKTFPIDESHEKIPAGWLIEACGLKGNVIHGMKIHDGNAVVLINESAASYADLANARDEIITAVQDSFQITLEQEPLELNAPEIPPEGIHHFTAEIN